MFRAEQMKERKSRLGSSFGSCLALSALVIGVLVWAYFHFIQDRHLQNPVDGLTFVTVDNGAQLADFKKRTAKEIGFMKQNKDLLATLYKGAKSKKMDKSTFEQKKYELLKRLRESASLLHSRNAPKKLKNSYTELCQSLGDFYEAILALDEGYYATEDKIAEEKFKAAKKHYSKGTGNLTRGSKGMAI